MWTLDKKIFHNMILYFVYHCVSQPELKGRVRCEGRHTSPWPTGQIPVCFKYVPETPGQVHSLSHSEQALRNQQQSCSGLCSAGARCSPSRQQRPSMVRWPPRARLWCSDWTAPCPPFPSRRRHACSGRWRLHCVTCSDLDPQTFLHVF